MERVRTIKLTIEYDGTNYQGWQTQPKGKTLQGVLEEKLKQITGEEVHVIGSGRTDAGVHALGQVAHIKTRTKIEVPSLQRALNSLLPKDILVKKMEEVGKEFHARRQAKSKLYEYRILNQPLRSVFHRFYSWHIPQRLDLEEMKKATKLLIGEQDFSSFLSSGSFPKTSVRKVLRARWKKDREGVLRFEIEANGFLKQMVRAIVGTLVEVGRGKLSPEEFQKIIQSKDRRKAGPTAPPHGLFLKEVRY
ncbi:MAG: tRNA pseudouridine(38-40) synthase TruA [Thermodesulfobacteriota bacterium]